MTLIVWSHCMDRLTVPCESNRPNINRPGFFNQAKKPSVILWQQEIVICHAWIRYQWSVCCTFHPTSSHPSHFLSCCLQKIFIIPILIHFREVMEYKLWMIFQRAIIKLCTLQIVFNKIFNYSDIWKIVFKDNNITKERS